jgi:hypothetical protein
MKIVRSVAGRSCFESWPTPIRISASKSAAKTSKPWEPTPPDLPNPPILRSKSARPHNLPRIDQRRTAIARERFPFDRQPDYGLAGFPDSRSMSAFMTEINPG